MGFYLLHTITFTHGEVKLVLLSMVSMQERTSFVSERWRGTVQKLIETRSEGNV